MTTEQLLPLDDWCVRLDIETSFVLQLHEHGLVHIVTEESTLLYDVRELKRLEQYAHLYHDLDINIEGIEAISHLLERIEDLQHDRSVLQNRLRRYE